MLHLCIRRGCTWANAKALLDQAKSDESLAQNATSTSASTSASSAARSRRAPAAPPSSMSGYYITRNAYQGKYFICLIIEKSYINTRGSNVIIVRPTTGRNEMNKMVRIHFITRFTATYQYIQDSRF